MPHRIVRVVVVVVAAILLLQVGPVAADPASMPTITAIAGGGHTCALTTEGGVMCWGANSSGQLGDGSTTDRLVPVDATGLATGVMAIAAGAGHTCALTSSGGVKCWGDNLYGALGNGTTTNSATPVDASGLTSGASAIAAGNGHTCALTIGGGVTCWGYNTHVHPATSDSLTPLDVPGLTNSAIAIAAGWGHTCALTSGGGVKCWGNLTDRSSTPADVSGLTSGVTAIAAGTDLDCALTGGGAVKCWGYNNRGQLGNDSTTDSLVPVDVTGLGSGVTAITAGRSHACAITVGGGVKCWGANGYGGLGNGTAIDSRSPVDVSGLASGVSAIAAGAHHTCGLTQSGRVKCWGYNHNGQLGNGSTTDSLLPVDVILDSTSGALPATDAADEDALEGRADFPLFPLLVGMGVGIALLVRRRDKEPHNGRSPAPGPR